jgi:hypothetical protein
VAGTADAHAQTPVMGEPSWAWMSRKPLWPPWLPPSLSLTTPGSSPARHGRPGFLGLDLEEARQCAHRLARDS